MPYEIFVVPLQFWAEYSFPCEWCQVGRIGMGSVPESSMVRSLPGSFKKIVIYPSFAGLLTRSCMLPSLLFSHWKTETTNHCKFCLVLPNSNSEILFYNVVKKEAY